MAKTWIITYIRNGRDLPMTPRIVLHEPNCRYLQPNSNRPYTGRRPATAAELKSQPKCKVC